MLPCASLVVAISVPHRSYGSAHSVRSISVGPQVVVNIPTTIRPTDAISGSIRRLTRSRIPRNLAPLPTQLVARPGLWAAPRRSPLPPPPSGEKLAPNKSPLAARASNPRARRLRHGPRGLRLIGEQDD